MNRAQDSTLFLISPKKSILVACKLTYYITILRGKLGTKYEICIDFYVILAGVPEPMHWDVGTGSHLIFGKYSNSIPIKRGRLIQPYKFDIQLHISKNKRCQLLIIFEKLKPPENMSEIPKNYLAI